MENLQLFILQNEHFEKISQLAKEKGAVRYLDPKGYVGFDIFDEELDEPVE